MTRALSHLRAGTYSRTPFASVELDHDGRHLRRRLISLSGGDDILVDLAVATALEHGDALVLEDGRLVEIIAAEEDLLEIAAADTKALHVLAWHLGNRHLPAQIEAGRILIVRDKIIEDMLHTLGAVTRPVRERFTPERGAYHGHQHG